MAVHAVFVSEKIGPLAPELIQASIDFRLWLLVHGERRSVGLRHPPLRAMKAMVAAHAGGRGRAAARARPKVDAARSAGTAPSAHRLQRAYRSTRSGPSHALRRR